MRESRFGKALTQLIAAAPVVPINNDDRIVIFSDLHLGNGGSRDDFLPNAALFQTVLKNYYLKKHFKLVLNGDIEELQRFPFHQIMNRWQGVYRIFREFERAQAFYKIIGNHDWELARYHHPFLSSPVYPALIFNRPEQQIIVFHGHQASLLMGKCHKLCKWILRYLANPIGIKNFAVSPENKYLFKTEKKVYRFAKERKVVTLIGHTHRPFFESLGVTDRLNCRIDELCRAYSAAEPCQRKDLASHITACSGQLRKLTNRKNYPFQNSLYNRETLIPCLFNSGSAIAKNGIFALEIAAGNISLVYWSDPKKIPAATAGLGVQTLRLDEGEYMRRVIKADNLDYIFTRIKLLA